MTDDREQGADPFEDTRPGKREPDLDAGDLAMRGVLASVEEKLFGISNQLQIGRYTVDRELGRGGMGVVYLGFDPELDRKVAIKVIRPAMPGAGQATSMRLRREAQAMARLSHPNVVPVFDVGTLDGQLYIAMEYVRGATLTRWLAAETRSWREILSEYLQAARGLAAAHAAGIWHRDFKPDNVLVGDDGRARVLDFGLATEDSQLQETSASETSSASSGALSMSMTRTGSLLGTPAYMSPEQHEGEPADGRSDQFSFCVALWRALYEKKPFEGETVAEIRDNVCSGVVVDPPTRTPVPPAIERALRRGLERDAARRHDSMEDLIGILEPYVRQKTRRRRIIASVAVLGVLTGGVMTTLLNRPVGLCADSEARVGAVWGTEQRDAVSSVISSARRDQTRPESLLEPLDAYATEWSALVEQTCEGDAAKGESSHLRLSCFEARLQEFDSLVSMLSTEEEQIDLRDGETAIRSLTPLSRCMDERRLGSMPAPPTKKRDAVAVQSVRVTLARARPLLDLGRFEEAERVAVETSKQARILGYDPLIAEALLFQGEMLALTGRSEEAVEVLMDSVDAGETSGHDRVVAQASVHLVETLGFQRGQGQRAEDWARRSQASLERIGGDDEVSARLAVAMSRKDMINGRLGDSLSSAREAVRLSEDGSRSSRDTLAQLALVLALTGQYDEARMHATKAADTADPARPGAILGSGTLGVVETLAGNHEQARPALERCLEWGTGRRPQIASFCASHLALVECRNGAYGRGLARHEEALERLGKVFGDKGTVYGRGLHYRAACRLEGGQDPALARADWEQVREIWSVSIGPNHRSMAVPLTGIGRSQLAAGDTEAALATLRRARELVEQPPQGHAAEDACTHLGLAEALLATNAPVSEIRRELDAAAKLYETLGPDYARERKRIDEITAEAGGD